MSSHASAPSSPPVSVEYRARVFHQSPLFRVLFDHYRSFLRKYPTRFQSQFGFFRSCIDDTIDRFLLCGDPREGVAVYSCDSCSQKKIVPFSCKTRLFCPSCHQKRVLLWAEDLIAHTLSDVPHRFFTFSIPKRLRFYFLHDRKLLRHLVFAAHRTFELALGTGKTRRDHRIAAITLIQTHGDTLNWNCHLHILAADGAFNVQDPEEIVFHPCGFWDLTKMTEIFRFTLIDRLHRAGVLSDDIATNLMSWPHVWTRPFVQAEHWVRDFKQERCSHVSGLWLESVFFRALMESALSFLITRSA